MQVFKRLCRKQIVVETIKLHQDGPMWENKPIKMTPDWLFDKNTSPMQTTHKMHEIMALELKYI